MAVIVSAREPDPAEYYYLRPGGLVAKSTVLRDLVKHAQAWANETGEPVPVHAGATFFDWPRPRRATARPKKKALVKKLGRFDAPRSKRNPAKPPLRHWVVTLRHGARMTGVAVRARSADEAAALALRENPTYLTASAKLDPLRR